MSSLDHREQSRRLKRERGVPGLPPSANSLELLLHSDGKFCELLRIPHMGYPDLCRGFIRVRELPDHLVELKLLGHDQEVVFGPAYYQADVRIQQHRVDLDESDALVGAAKLRAYNPFEVSEAHWIEIVWD